MVSNHSHIPENTKYYTIVDLLLCQRRRQWASIQSTQYLVFIEIGVRCPGSVIRHVYAGLLSWSEFYGTAILDQIHHFSTDILTGITNDRARETS